MAGRRADDLLVQFSTPLPDGAFDATVTLADHGPRRWTCRPTKRPPTAADHPELAAALGSEPPGPRELAAATVRTGPDSGKGRPLPQTAPSRALPTRIRRTRLPAGRSAQFAVGSAGAVDSTASRPVCRPITARHSSGPGQRRSGRRRPSRARTPRRPRRSRRPAGRATSRRTRRTPAAPVSSRQRGRVDVEVDQVHVAGDPAQPALVARRRRRGRRPGTARCRSRTARPRGTRTGSTARSHQPGSTSRISTWLGRPRTTPSVPVSEWSRT